MLIFVCTITAVSLLGLAMVDILRAATLDFFAFAQALVSLGDDVGIGSEVVLLVAGDGTPPLGFTGLAPLFAPAELHMLLELERKAVLAGIAAAQGESV